MNAKASVAAIAVTIALPIAVAAYSQKKDKSAVAMQAFLRAWEVFKKPRCVNCHPIGDSPLQGDDGHPHLMHVVRGQDGIGKNGLWCSTCRREMNLPGAHMPPGCPGWQLPPKDMPMVFERKMPAELCQQFKDQARNGNRNPDEVVEHVETAPLVLWAWNPGGGRTAIPVSHEEFVKNMKEWVDNGADCPE